MVTASRQSGLSIYDAGVTFPSAVQNSDGNFGKLKLINWLVAIEKIWSSSFDQND